MAQVDKRALRLSRVAIGYLKLLAGTMRFKKVNYQPIKDLTGPKIVAGWHGRSLAYAVHFRNKGEWVIISHSRDGEIQNRVFKKMGFQVIRGSTGRGGIRAAIEGIKALRDGGTMAITPDGPRGPSGVLQGGVMLMAQKSGAALVPIGISSKPCIYAKSWDRYQLPLPFAKCIMIFGEPIYVPAEATEPEVEAIRLKMEAEMHRLEREADGKS